jgi:hypothetical protein
MFGDNCTIDGHGRNAGLRQSANARYIEMKNGSFAATALVANIQTKRPTWLIAQVPQERNPVLRSLAH